MANRESMKRRLIKLLGLLTLLGILLLTVRFWPQERLLLKQAVRVTDTHGWEVDRGPDACITYGWLSGQEVLFCRGGFLSNSPLWRRNVRTGKETPLKALSRLFHDTKGDPDGVKVSPDGRWVLWHGGQDDTVCAAVDGSSSFRSHPANNYSSFGWLGGSDDQWVEFIQANKHSPGRLSTVILHKAASQTTQPLPPTDMSWEPWSDGIAVQNAAGACMLMQPTRRELGDMPKTDRMEITQTVLASPAPPPHRFEIRVPPGSTVHRIVLSPDGKYAAWALQTHFANPILERIHRLVPSVSAPFRDCIGLWVSRVDGSEMHEIGHLRDTINSSKGDPREGNGWIDDYTLRWLPDGKQLSFVYKDALYRVMR